MKIGVDAACLGIKDDRLKVGVYWVALNLLQQLGRIDRKNDYLLYSFFPIKPKIRQSFGKRMKNVVAGPAFGWRYLALPLALKRHKTDLFLGLSQALPAFGKVPAITMVHDLGFEHFPEGYQNLSQIQGVTRQAVKKAQKIIAVSSFTKNNLKKFYSLSDKKIKVIYEGVEPIFKPQSAIKVKQVREKYNLSADYFLFVGSLKKSKNLPRLLTAFAQFFKATQADYQLALAGSNYWPDERIAEVMAQYGLEKKVKILGFVSEADLPALYSGAIAFVSPSLYEGFGLTLLEAMACGCPVVAGNQGAEEEVVGKAGILVDPKNTTAISQALTKMTSPKLRKKLSQLGLNQAKKFTWTKTAQQTLGLIEAIALNRL